jgi:hypothetical protein
MYALLLLEIARKVGGRIADDQRRPQGVCTFAPEGIGLDGEKLAAREAN